MGELYSVRNLTWLMCRRIVSINRGSMSNAEESEPNRIATGTCLDLMRYSVACATASLCDVISIPDHKIASEIAADLQRRHTEETLPASLAEGLPSTAETASEKIAHSNSSGSVFTGFRWLRRDWTVRRMPAIFESNSANCGCE